MLPFRDTTREKKLISWNTIVFFLLFNKSARKDPFSLKILGHSKDHEVYLWVKFQIKFPFFWFFYKVQHSFQRIVNNSGKQNNSFSLLYENIFLLINQSKLVNSFIRISCCKKRWIKIITMRETISQKKMVNGMTLTHIFFLKFLPRWLVYWNSI